MGDKLTSKQAKFVAEYLSNGLVASKAAISAGYSEKGAEVTGSQLLRHPKVSVAIANKTQKTLAKIQGEQDYSVERTMEYVARMAFFDPKDLFEDDGSLKQIKDIPAEARTVLAGLEVTEMFEGDGEQKHAFGLLKKVKLGDRLSALDKLMRYHALYRDKVEHTGKDGGPVQFVISRVGTKQG